MATETPQKTRQEKLNIAAQKRELAESNQRQAAYYQRFFGVVPQDEMPDDKIESARKPLWKTLTEGWSAAKVMFGIGGIIAGAWWYWRTR